jgi:hypothetical protein
VLVGSRVHEELTMQHRRIFIAGIALAAGGGLGY